MDWQNFFVKGQIVNISALWAIHSLSQLLNSFAVVGGQSLTVYEEVIVPVCQ